MCSGNVWCFCVLLWMRRVRVGGLWMIGLSRWLSRYSLGFSQNQKDIVGPQRNKKKENIWNDYNLGQIWTTHFPWLFGRCVGWVFAEFCVRFFLASESLVFCKHHQSKKVYLNISNDRKTDAISLSISFLLYAVFLVVFVFFFCVVCQQTIWIFRKIHSLISYSELQLEANREHFYSPSHSPNSHFELYITLHVFCLAPITAHTTKYSIESQNTLVLCMFGTIVARRFAWCVWVCDFGRTNHLI